MPSPALIIAGDPRLVVTAPPAPPITPPPGTTGPVGIPGSWKILYRTTFAGGVLPPEFINNRTVNGTPGSPSIEGPNNSGQIDYSDSRNVVLSDGLLTLNYSKPWPGGQAGKAYGGAHVSAYQEWLKSGTAIEVVQKFPLNGGGWPATVNYRYPQQGWGEIDNPEFDDMRNNPTGWLNVHDIQNGVYGAQSLGSTTGNYYPADNQWHTSSTYWNPSGNMIQARLDGALKQQAAEYHPDRGGYGLFFELGVAGAVTLGTNPANNFQVPGLSVSSVTVWGPA